MSEDLKELLDRGKELEEFNKVLNSHSLGRRLKKSLEECRDIYKAEELMRLVVIDLFEANHSFGRDNAFLKDQLFNSRNEWVSVEERLPEECIYVLTCKSGRCPAVRFMNEDGDWYGHESGLDYGTKDVTHWQPLPKPPEGE